MGVFTGTGRLLRLALRRDRIKLPVWILLIVGFMGSMIPALKEAYGAVAEQAAYQQLLETSAIGRLFAGAPTEVSFGAVVTGETLLYFGLAIAFMNTLLVIRHTRHNEELGSSELLQSARVGRYAALTSALLLALAANTVVAVGLASVLQGVNGISSSEAWAFGLGQGLVGLSFAAIAGVTAQLAGASRGANSLAAMAIGAAFLLRGIGDIFTTTNQAGETSSLWISLLSPFGWLQQMQPLTVVAWWPIVLFVLFIAAGIGLSYVLLAHRDVGVGIFPARKGRARAARKLLAASPFGLTLRLQKGVFIGWAITAGIFALIIGGMANQMVDLIEDSEVMQQYIAGLGGTTAAVESMLSAMLGIVMLMIGAYVVQGMQRARSEETRGYLESLLATALGRTRWLLAHTIVVVIGAASIAAASGTVVAIAAGLAAGSPFAEWQIGAYTLAGLSYVPALLVFAGITVFGMGIVPKFAVGLAWAAFAFVALIGQFGSLLKLPDWTINMSPFAHIAAAPSAAIAWQPLLVLTAISSVLLLIGFVGFGRRDLQTS